MSADLIEIMVPWICSALGLGSIFCNSRYSLWGPMLALATIPLWAAFVVVGHHWGMIPAEIAATVMLLLQFKKWRRDGRTWSVSASSASPAV